MANFRGKIQTDLGLSKFSQYRPVGRVRADTSAKPVLDASARTFEALGNLSPTLMKLAAYQVGLQKEEIRSEEQKRFSSASLEERRRFAEGEALEEERQNPTFAGSNPWRRVIRQEIAGQHAAEVNLLSELERRRDSLTDHDRSIEDIKSEMQSLQAQYRPDSLYGGRAYDASAAAVVQQNEGRFLAIRGRKQEAATIEAITTGIQDQFVLAVESGAVDAGAIRGLLDRNHSLNGTSGLDLLRRARESVAAIYDQRHKAGSISLEDYEEALAVIYGVEISMHGPSSAQVSSPDTGERFAYQRDEETGELVPPKLRVQAIESSGKTHFVVIPEDMSKEDFEAAVGGGAVYESFPTYVSEEAAQAVVADPKKYLRPDGTQRNQAPTISSHDDLQRSVAEDKRRQAARDYDSAKLARSKEDADRRLVSVTALVHRRMQEDVPLEEIKEEAFQLLAKIGEDTGYQPFVDETDVVEDALVRDMIAERVARQGYSSRHERKRVIGLIANNEYSEVEVWQNPFLTLKDKQVLSGWVGGFEGAKTQLLDKYAPGQGDVTNALAASKLARQSEATSQEYIQNLVSDVQAEFLATVMDGLSEEENNPEGWGRRMSEIDITEWTRKTVNSLVEADVRRPNAGVDVTDLFLQARVQSHLTNFFKDKIGFDAAGNFTKLEAGFTDSMVAYVEEWRDANPEGSWSKLVEDFVSEGNVGFKAFHEKADPTTPGVMTKEDAEALAKRDENNNRNISLSLREQRVDLGAAVEVTAQSKEFVSKVDEMIERRAEDLAVSSEELQEYGELKSDFIATEGGIRGRLDGYTPEQIQAALETGSVVIGQRKIPTAVEATMRGAGAGFRTITEDITLTREDVLRMVLGLRAGSAEIDGERASLTLEEIQTGELRIPGKEGMTLRVPREAFDPYFFPMVPDAESLESYTDEDWTELYESLHPAVQEKIEIGVRLRSTGAESIPEFLKGHQRSVFIRTFRISPEVDK